MAVGKAIVSRMGRVGFARLRQWFERLGAELMHGLDDNTVLQAVRNFTVGQPPGASNDLSGSASPFAR
jgi:hypothetical protein